MAPDDDVVIGRLQLPPLSGATRLDALVRVDDGDTRRIDDVPFDATTGEVLTLPSPVRVRGLTTQRMAIRLLAIGAGGERAIGDYTLDHGPWPQAVRR
jgi:hypothetical protein